MNQPTERTRKIYRVTWIGMVVNYNPQIQMFDGF